MGGIGLDGLGGSEVLGSGLLCFGGGLGIDMEVADVFGERIV